ncbi:MFS transporter [Eggerthella lenta]|uniref:MFS transporter n=1 Tax=Eggerthella lenta TaxID=84112 RepID=UPI0018993CD0|nr:MFS transporter [Eggerthella lenta]MDB1793088.1 MFS transporter [Eggerthella lenta]
MGNAKKRSGSVASMLPVLLACSFTASFGQSMMNVALPELAERFGVTLSIANWVIVGYMVVAATAIMLSAFMLRRLGLRRVFFVGAGALALGSACALLSQDFPMLFASRLVQAVGTGLFFPSVTSVIMTNSPAAVRGTRLALNSGVIAVGLAISPTASGFALTQFGWRAMFVVSLAMSVALLAVGFFRIHGGPSTKRVPIDALSVMLGPLGLAAFLYGLGEVTRDLAPSLAALAVGAVLLALFAWRQFALESPLLDLHPLVHPRFAVGILLVMVGMLTSFSMSILLPLYYEGALGYTAFFAGLLLLGPVLVNAAFTFLGGRVFDRHGAWPLIPAGLVLVLVGQAAAFFSAESMIAILIVLSSAAVYAGAGFVVAPSKTAALGTLPPATYSAGASINSTAAQIASAIGSSLFVGVLSADVLRDTAAGAAKASAYAAAFEHTLSIAVAIAVAGLLVAFFYARAMRKPAGKQR